MKYFRDRGALSRLPGAFLGGLGVKGIDELQNHELEQTLVKLKEHPDSLDEGQKALLLKKVRKVGNYPVESMI